MLQTTKSARNSLTSGHRPGLTTARWVCDVLRGELISGEYPANVLPGEDALMRKYGVSRGTIRRVLEMLRQQGLIERVRGAGTFLTSQGALFHDIEQSRDVAQEVNATAVRIAINTTYTCTVPALDFIARSLEIRTGDDVVIIESTSFLDGFPLSYRSSFLPADLFSSLAANPDLNLNRSPYEYIGEIIQEPIGETELQINSSTADLAASEILRVPLGFPLLDTTRVIRAAGRAVEFSMSHARGDRIVFSTRMIARTSPDDTALRPAQPHAEQIREAS
jgi:GntR family transcriptional regulator